MDIIFVLVRKTNLNNNIYFMPEVIYDLLTHIFLTAVVYEAENNLKIPNSLWKPQKYLSCNLYVILIHIQQPNRVHWTQSSINKKTRYNLYLCFVRKWKMFLVCDLTSHHCVILLLYYMYM